MSIDADFGFKLVIGCVLAATVLVSIVIVSHISLWVLLFITVAVVIVAFLLFTAMSYTLPMKEID